MGIFVMIMYHDRIEAGHALAMALEQYRNKNGVVLAVPRGGVPVAYVVASELKMPLEILLTKKIGHPLNNEYAIGAVSLTDRYIEFPGKISPEYILAETERQRKRLRDMYSRYMGYQKPKSIEGKIAIVVDDGVATGNTLMATVNMLRMGKPSEIVIAVPVASEAAAVKLRKHADVFVCPLIPEEFYGVGQFFEDFDQVSDEKVSYYLQKIHKELNNHRAV